MATTKLDKFGRVLIPKSVRDGLGLEPGTELLVEEQDDGIVMKPAERSSLVKVKRGVLVFTGKATGDMEQAVKEERERRARKVAGLGD